MRIKAFTLVEIIVVMLLTAILVSAIGMVYTSLIRVQISSFDNAGKEADMIILTNVLQKDCAKARIIYYKTNELCCNKLSGNVYYEFLPDQILRKGINVDTFHYTTGELKVNYIDSAHVVINRIALTIYSPGDSIPFDYYKQYGAEFLFEDKEK